MMNAGKQLDPKNIYHRFSVCPTLPRELQTALRQHESAVLAGVMEELGECGLPDPFGFSEDFVTENDGWGDAQVDGQDAMSAPDNNHPLAKAVRFQDGEVINDGQRPRGF